MARNYRKEYDRYQGTAAQKKRRAGRNAKLRSLDDPLVEKPAKVMVKMLHIKTITL